MKPRRLGPAESWASAMRRYFLETFGCQMNILDSQLVEGQLRARGMTPAVAYRDADVILFNTCSVRQHAEDKVLSRLGQLRGLKRRRPETIIGVIGCMAEREKEGLFVRAPHVDLLCGPGELNRLPALLDEAQQRHEHVAALAGSLSRRTEVLHRALEYDSLEALDLSRAASVERDTLQSYIRVQRGCDKFCTYCVVPFTRGPERSRPPGHLVDEAKMLAERGCREITLLGQTVNSYLHQEDGRPVPFARLLERVHAVEGIDRVRFVTSFPADWDEDIFRVMRDFPRLMPYLHIPAQSGSDRVLRAMKRGYTAASYRRLMDTARSYLPDVALAGDIIVGFCGETDADFRATVELTRGVQYSGLYVFKYSPRPGTKADRNLADDVPLEVKQARNNELLAIQSEIMLRQKQAWVGRTVEVLVEGYSKLARRSQGEHNGELRTRGKRSPSFSIRGAAAIYPAGRRAPSGLTPAPSALTPWPSALAPAPFDLASEQDRGAEVSREPSSQLVGRTPQDVITLFDAPPTCIGALVKVRVESATPHSLFGRVVEVISPPRGAGQRSATIGLPVVAPGGAHACHSPGAWI